MATEPTASDAEYKPGDIVIPEPTTVTYGHIEIYDSPSPDDLPDPEDEDDAEE